MYIKPVKTITELIDLLRSRGFSIPEDQEDRVKHFLETEGYYHTSSYIKSFYTKGSSDKVAKHGIPFENVIRLYYCEKNLQHMSLFLLLKIESFLKAKLIHITADLYKDPFWYKKPNNLYKGKFEDCQVLVNEIIEENKKSPIIMDFQKKHGKGDIPFWYLVEVASFGPFLKFFYFIKNEVLQEFYVLFGVNQRNGTFYKKQFFGWLNALCKLRNRVAHSEAIWSIRALPKITLSNYGHKLNTTTAYVCLIAWFLSKAELSPTIKIFYDMISFLDMVSQIQGITFAEKQRIGINGNRIERIENWAISVGFTTDKIA